MCQFASWKKRKSDGKVIFLKSQDLVTKKGKELEKYLGNSYLDDIKGHGAIDWYFDLKPEEWINHECEDFSSPENFPVEIVEAIKNGEFAGIGICPKILTPGARKEYDKIENAAWEEYEKIKNAARKEYDKIENYEFWKLVKVKKNRIKKWK